MGAGHVGTLSLACTRVPDCQKESRCPEQIVYTANQSYQLTVNWGYSESQVPRHQPGSNLASGLSEDSSGRPVVFILFCTGWICLLNHRHVFPTCNQTQCPQTYPLPLSCCTYNQSSRPPSLPILFTGPQMPPILSVPTAAQHHLIPAWLRQLSEQASPIPFDIPPI